MPKSTPNMELWNELAPVDRAFTKKITGKSYSGDSPNPTYVIRKLTEALGPIGSVWGFTEVYHETRLGKPHVIVTRQRVVYSPENDADGKPKMMERDVSYEIVREEYDERCIRFWFDSPSGQNHVYDAVGGTPRLYMSKSGVWIHDEDAGKKSLTDAITKGASWLGACAEIFLGLFDDKYTGNKDDGHDPSPRSVTEPASDPIVPKAPGQRADSSADGAGW